MLSHYLLSKYIFLFLCFSLLWSAILQRHSRCISCFADREWPNIIGLNNWTKTYVTFSVAVLLHLILEMKNYYVALIIITLKLGNCWCDSFFFFRSSIIRLFEYFKEFNRCQYYYQFQEFNMNRNSHHWNDIFTRNNVFSFWTLNVNFGINIYKIKYIQRFYFVLFCLAFCTTRISLLSQLVISSFSGCNIFPIGIFNQIP